MFRFQIEGAKNVPSDGGLILCVNHKNGLDPILLALAAKRQVCFIGKKELFENKFLGALYRKLGSFPVDRDATDMTAYRKSLDVLARGDVLGIFAQGTRYATDNSAKAGVALFALKSGAPVVPVGISSSYKFFSKVKVRFGEPMPLEEFRGKKIRTEILDEAKEKIMAKVFELVE